jgi:RteC protein
VELLTSIYQNNSIERKDGKSLTRKELMDYFQELFGMEIKDVEVKLARATNRNDKTPFLDRLTTAFENYAEEKEEKQMKRK